MKCPNHAFLAVIAVLRCVGLLLFAWCPAPSLQAHTTDAMTLEFRNQDGRWSLEGEMHVALLRAVARGEETVSPMRRSDLMKASPAELERIRRDCVSALHCMMRMTFAGKEIGWRVEFPDFETQPPNLPGEDDDDAMTVLRMVVDAPQQEGEFKLHWTGMKESPLTVLTDSSGDGMVVSLLPGEELLLANGEAAESSDAVDVKASGTMVFAGWVRSGYHHVLPLGLDHMMFILGLFLMVPQWKPLLRQSVMFTFAHSLTLALCVSGWVAPPSRLVEILIAFSIVFIGVENLFSHKVGRLRLYLVFGFGLVHGMGFASVLAGKLAEFPRMGIAGPLLGFNLGVELAQISVLAMAFLVLWPLRRWMNRVRMYGSILVALGGAVWLIERIFT